MRTVSKKVRTFGLLPFVALSVFGCLTLVASQTWAADPTTDTGAAKPAAADTTTTTTTTTSSTATPSSPAPVAINNVTLPGGILPPPKPSRMPPPPPTPLQFSAVGDKTESTTIAGAEAKGTSSVKEVMHHLNNSVENVTINDLNSARQAIAKIDILIELEKKMAELEKIRQERENKVMPAALPASALTPGQTTEAALPMPMGGNVDLVRVIGITGHYRAIIKAGYDGNKTVDVGDALSNGEIITAISTTSMTLDRRGMKHVVRIKNVDKVFGTSP